MQKPKTAMAATLLFIAGCTAQPVETVDAVRQDGGIPEAVAARAAPGQDLSSARLDPDDNCYWYEHKGPVESTLVPLRTVGGAPLCTVRRS